MNSCNYRMYTWECPKKYIDVEDFVNQLDIHLTIKIKTYNKENNNEQRKQKI